MKIILNEQGFVNAYALVGSFGSDQIEVDEPVDLQDFEDNYRSYYLSDGKLVKSDDRQREIEDKRLVTSLRSQREKICFPVINRGQLWYGKLTDSQRTELDTWYQAWLDVTETRVVPEMPEWLV